MKIEGYDRFGTNSSDYLSSGGGNEVIWGLGENDTVATAIAGSKYLLGGTGNDAYRISNYSYGNIVIYEAPNHGSNDKIF